DMQMPSLAVRRPQLAFKYLDSYDPAPLNDYLKRREAVGGWDDNDLFAAVILKIHANDHTGLASLIETHRARVQELLTPPRTLLLEVQALIYSGQASAARSVLQEHAALLDRQAVAGLEAEIKAAEGSDPVAEYQRVYEEHQTIDSLRILVNAL